MNSPCKDCKDRHKLCHDKCEKYKAWVDDQQKRKKYIAEKNYDPRLEFRQRYLNRIGKGNSKYHDLFHNKKVK